jgi:hypothetical protein
VAEAQNPFPILVRSRRDYGLEAHGYVTTLTDRFEITALTGTFEAPKNLPDGMDVILHFFGNLRRWFYY